MKNLWQSKRKLLNCILWTCFTPYYLKLCSRRLLHSRPVISIDVYCASIGRFYNRLWDFANARNVVSIRSGNVYNILLLLLFLLLYLPILLHAPLALFLLITTDVTYVNSVGFKHLTPDAIFLSQITESIILTFSN